MIPLALQEAGWFNFATARDMNLPILEKLKPTFRTSGV
jgi:hypothetical protein